MKYVNLYSLIKIKDKKPRRRSYRRLNTRDLEKIFWLGELIVRNGCPVLYKGGYLTPINRLKFSSAQEVSNFLHTDGRKGLYRITRHSDWWSVVECVQMPTKKQALERVAKDWSAYVYSWKDNEDIY